MAASNSLSPDTEGIEDARSVVSSDVGGLMSFVGVCDGHGGAEVAVLFTRQFHTELLRMDELLQKSNEWKKLIRPCGDCIELLKTDVCAHLGSFTQTTPYVAPQGLGITECMSGNVGNQIIIGSGCNSRCVFSSNVQAVTLYIGQNEKQSIQGAGGRVTKEKAAVSKGEQFQGYQLLVYQIDGSLAVSEVIAEFAFKQIKYLHSEEQLKACYPVIILYKTNDTKLLVKQSDGIWNYVTWDVSFFPLFSRDGVASKTGPDSECQHLKFDEEFIERKDGTESRSDDSNGDSGGEREVLHLGKWSNLLIAFLILSLAATVQCANAPYRNGVCPVKKMHSYILQREICPVRDVPGAHWIHAKRENTHDLDFVSRPLQLPSFKDMGFLLALVSCTTPWKYIKEIKMNASHTVLLWEIKAIHVWACNFISSIIYYGSWIMFDITLNNVDPDKRKGLLSIIYKDLAFASAYTTLLMILAYCQRETILTYFHSRKATRIWLGLLLCYIFMFLISFIFNLNIVGAVAIMSMIPMYITRWITAKGFKLTPFMLKVGGLLGLFLIYDSTKHWLQKVAYISWMVFQIIELLITMSPWWRCWLSRFRGYVGL